MKNTNDNMRGESFFPPESRKILELSRQIAAELRKNYHPHMAVVIESDRMWMTEMILYDIIDDE
ncbi:hypothetical protein [uncultured Pseudoramibacter sp.]|uniref:hypothetical protein n=1 Tax=uncultured Pseudoramibacter sp. TaxID=1623493 RepID=UPI0025E4A4E0|nr:hypothetical protein [uncultured Pseudoramibacter sp.]